MSHKFPDSLRTVDLCQESASRVQSAAFYALKDLARGERVLLVLAQEPALMMQSLDLQLRHKLAWDCVEADGKWRVEVRHRDDAAPRDVIELMARDHKRLDVLFVRAMQSLNRGDASGAAPLLHAFAGALRRHMHAEDVVLAPAFGAAGDPDSPFAIMLREHGELRGQLAVIEECLAADPPQPGEIGAFCAILSGTLAKHEHREEGNLFPLWRGRLARLPTAQQEELMARVEGVLGGERGEALGERG
jgi:uncharacterized protein (DUF2249 family)